jgi:integrase
MTVRPAESGSGAAEPDGGPAGGLAPVDGPVMSTTAALAVAGDDLDGLLVEAAELLATAKARNTLLAYDADWHRFDAWCARRGLPSLPATPVTVAAYLTDAAGHARGGRGHAPSTLTRWLAAINHRHRMAGHTLPGQHPHVAELLASIRRHKARPPVRKDALLLEDLRGVLAHVRSQDRWPAVVAATRDACLLLVGFAGAFRRSELAGMRVTDVTIHRHDGLHITLARSKGDQEARGQVKAIPYGTSPDTCAPCAYVRWRQLAQAWDTGGRAALLRHLRPLPRVADGHLCRITPLPAPDTDTEPVFRLVHRSGQILTGALSGQGVNDAVTRRAVAAGCPGISAHSLRIGFVTQARRNGAHSHTIMRQTGHKTEAMIDVYTRSHAPLDGNAVTTLGL